MAPLTDPSTPRQGSSPGGVANGHRCATDRVHLGVGRTLVSTLRARTRRVKMLRQLPATANARRDLLV
jgi:hypothetical protein